MHNEVPNRETLSRKTVDKNDIWWKSFVDAIDEVIDVTSSSFSRKIINNKLFGDLLSELDCTLSSELHDMVESAVTPWLIYSKTCFIFVIY